MNAIECLLAKARIGKVSGDHAHAIEEIYQQNIASGKSQDEAALAALNDFKSRVQGEVSPRTQNLLERGAVSFKAAQEAEKFIEGRKGYDLRESFRDLFLVRPDERARAYQIQYAVPLKDTFEKLQKTRLNTPNEALSDNIIKGLYGQQSDVAVNSYVKAVQDVIRSIKNDFGEVAGKIADKNNTLPPLYLMETKVAKMAKEDFINLMSKSIRWDLLNKEIPELVDQVTGTVRHSAEELAGMLYDKIVAGDLNNSLPYRRIFSNLYVNSAEEFSHLNKALGYRDITTTMGKFIDEYSREIARRDIVGYSPRVLGDYLIKKYIPNIKEQGKVTAFVQDIINHMNDSSRTTAPEALITAFNFAKGVYTGTYLINTPIQALFTDPFFVAIKRFHMGLNPFKGMFDILTTFKGTELRNLAAELGLIAQGVTESLDRSVRMVELGRPMAASDKFAAGSMLLSGLTTKTENNRANATLAFSVDLAKMVGLAWDKLPVKMKLSLKNNFINPEDWARLTTDMLTTREYKGVPIKVISPYQMSISDNPVAKELSKKIAGLIADVNEASVPTSYVGARQWLQDLSKKGSLGLITAQSMGMFSGFITSVFQHTLKEAFRRGNYFTGAAAVTAIMAAYLIPNGLYVQTKRLLDGKDPLPVNGDKFWEQNIASSLLPNQLTSFLFDQQGSLSLFGPIQGTIEDTGKIVSGNIRAAQQGKPTHITRDLSSAIINHIPGGPYNLLGLARKRALTEHIQQMIDGEYYTDKWRRDMQRELEAGSGYFSAPGSSGIQRAPDIKKLWK